jgi:hypothetical protein
MLSSHCAHQEIWLGSIQTGNSAEVTRASRAVANHRSMQRTSPGPWGPKRTVLRCWRGQSKRPPLPRILLEIVAWKASAICSISVLTAPRRKFNICWQPRMERSLGTLRRKIRPRSRQKFAHPPGAIPFSPKLSTLVTCFLPPSARILLSHR